jgi:hypothetical protein
MRRIQNARSIFLLEVLARAAVLAVCRDRKIDIVARLPRTHARRRSLAPSSANFKPAKEKALRLKKERHIT